MSESELSVLLSAVVAAGAMGLTPEAVGRDLPDISRSTLNRRLAALVKSGVVKFAGSGRATRYVAASLFTRADIDAYFPCPGSSARWLGSKTIC